MGTMLDIGDEAIYNKINGRYFDLESYYYNLGFGEIVAKWGAMLRLVRDDINIVSQAIAGVVAEKTKDVLHTNGWVIGGVTSKLGLYLNFSDFQVQTIAGGWIDRVNIRLDDLEQGAGDTEGITRNQLYNIMSSDYSLYTGTINDIFSQINAVNDKVDNIDLDIGDDVMEKINAALEKAEEFLKYLGNITATIWTAIEDQVTARAQEVFAVKIKPIESRVHDLEVDMKGYTSIFYDAILQLISFILLGLKVPQPRIEDAIADIEEWIAREVTEQTAEMKAEINAIIKIIGFEEQWWIDMLKSIIGETGDGNGGLSIADVQAIVNQYIAPLTSQINSVMTAVSGLQIPTEKQIRDWIQEYPPTIKIADYIGAIDVLLAKQITDKIILPADRISTVASYIVADTIAHQIELENTVKPIVEVMTAEMLTSLTDIVTAFGTPEALISYLINAPEGQEEPMLDLMQVLMTMTFERGL